jgi:drug/metabolite transporter (DMT)-like permease
MNSGFVFAISAAVSWGLVYVLSERVLRDFNPLTLNFLYGVLTTLLLLPFIWTGHIDLGGVTTSGRTVLSLVFAAVALTLVANFLILMSIDRLGAAPAALIEISYPLFTVLFTLAIFKVIPSWPTLAGGLLIMAGTAIITKFS